MQEDFIARATELGARVHVVSNDGEAVAEIVEVFRTSGASRAVASPDLGRLQEPICQALERAGANLVEGDTAEALATADLGVTRADLGIAETGSIAVAGTDLLTRLTSMLPLVHVAVLEGSAVVPTLDEAGEFLRQADRGGLGWQRKYVTLVSGPSRTSDVEKTLTIGVHGPGQLHIILLGQ